MSDIAEIKVYILTVSDRCSRNEAIDKSGPKLEERLKQWDSRVKIKRGCVPDEAKLIRSTIDAEYKEQNLILTTGGTGLAKRDVTVSAITPMFDKPATGISTALISQTMANTPFALLSNPIAGVKGDCFIVCMPGSAKAVMEYMDILCPVLSHILDIIADNKVPVTTLHATMTSDANTNTTSSNNVHVCPHKSGKINNIERQREHGTAYRARKSEWPMLNVDTALEIIKKEATGKTTAKVLKLDTSPLVRNLRDTPFGCIVRSDVIATEDVPNYRASIKDGYAVHSADGPGVYDVICVSEMGKSPSIRQLKPGQISRVTTGAPVPEGADAVVQVEDTELVLAAEDGEERQIRIQSRVSPGTDIRPIGSDISKGDILLPKGTKIKSAEIGLLASQGITDITVNTKPRVTLLSTGDELVTLDTDQLQYGQVRDCNSYTLSHLLQEDGFAAVNFKHIPDTYEDTLHFLEDVTSTSDVIISTGGVSMGETDHIKTVLRDLKAKIHFGRVFMKPGKPTTFATLPNGTLYFGLPGNPVSTMVTYKLFVLPALKSWHGESPRAQTIPIEIPETRFLDPRPEYIRAVYNKGITGGQCSSRLLSMRDANLLLQLPPRSEHQTSIEKGTVVDAMVIGSL